MCFVSYIFVSQIDGIARHNKKTYKTCISAKIRYTNFSESKSPHCLIELSLAKFKLFGNNYVLLTGLTLDSDEKSNLNLPSYKEVRYGKNICIHQIKKSLQKLKRVDLDRMKKNMYLF